MRKWMCCVACSLVSLAAMGQETPCDVDLPQLGEPCRYVDGAYYGVGVGVSCISHKINAVKNSAYNFHVKRSSKQVDLSVIGGFGAAFYKRYYAGIELEFFKRLKGNNPNGDEICSSFPATIGLNMDVRLGYQIPQYGSLMYVTVGFARVIGKTTFRINNAQRRRGNLERSFGSFYPTFGAGVEYKVNHNWNVRGDVRFSITSKDDNKHARVNDSTWKFDAKPSRLAFRFSITRSI